METSYSGEILKLTDISVQGGYPEQQRLVEHFTGYAMEAICGKRIAQQCTVNIELVANLEKTQGFLGFCIWTDEPYRGREFDIEIDANLHPRFLLTTLAHELVHIKQYAKGELRCLLTTATEQSWHGKRYKCRDITVRESTRLPWEVEARGLEEQLFIEWTEDCNIDDDWTYLNIHVD